jgi:hypothetical protein
MGQLYQARCQCGYKSDHNFYKGVGKKFLKSSLTEMGLCMNCREVFPISKDSKMCPTCNNEAYMYEDSQLSCDLKNEKIYVPKESIIAASKAFCPKCFKFNLHIAWCGFWD